MVLNLQRRRVLLSAAVGVAGMALTSTSAAETSSADPDISNVKSRMLDIRERGKTLTTAEKYMVLLATASAQGLKEEGKKIAVAALEAGVTPVEVREAIFQTTPYVGFGRMEQCLEGAMEAMKTKGIDLPLASQTKVTDKNRLEEGIKVQTGIFGSVITEGIAKTPDNLRDLMVGDLSGYCFGDFYTRSGLTVKHRELVVFSAIAALGGCEPQLKAHGNANLKEGATKQNLIDALQIAVPLNGFPRTLNALAVVQAL